MLGMSAAECLLTLLPTPLRTLLYIPAISQGEAGICPTKKEGCRTRLARTASAESGRNRNLANGIASSLREIVRKITERDGIFIGALVV